MAMNHTREMQVIVRVSLIKWAATAVITDWHASRRFYGQYSLYREEEGERVVKGDSVDRAESTIQALYRKSIQDCYFRHVHNDDI